MTASPVGCVAGPEATGHSATAAFIPTARTQTTQLARLSTAPDGQATPAGPAHIGRDRRAGPRRRPRPGPVVRLNVARTWCDALFVSGIQPSDAPTAEITTAAIKGVVRQFGSRGCAARMAQEFGDHPEAAAERMRWIRRLVAGYWPHLARPDPELPG